MAAKEHGQPKSIGVTVSIPASILAELEKETFQLIFTLAKLYP